MMWAFRAAQGALLLALLSAPSAASAREACPKGAVVGFSDLAERLTAELDGEAEVLRVQLYRHRDDRCRLAYEVALLRKDGEIEKIALNARTLEPFEVEDDDQWRRLGEADDAAKIIPARAIFAGSDARELLEGFLSDDALSGGPGRDLFVLSIGHDVIADFDPDEDVLDVRVFAREEGGYETLTSLAEIARRSEDEEVFDRPALVIDVDGDHGAWTTTLLGVSIEDLNGENVFFGYDDAEPPVEVTHMPGLVVTGSDGSVVYTPRHPIDEYPGEPELIVGDEAALEALGHPKDND